MPFDKHKHDYDPAVYTHLEGFFSPHFAGDKYTRFITRLSPPECWTLGMMPICSVLLATGVCALIPPTVHNLIIH